MSDKSKNRNVNVKDMTKDDLIKKVHDMSSLILQQTQKLNTQEELILSKDQIIYDLKDRVTNLENIQNQILTDDEVKKIILREHARERSILLIFYEITKIDPKITLDSIQDIITNIDKLDNELIEYFKNESLYYQKNKHLFTDDFKKNLMSNELENMVMEVTKMIHKYHKKSGILEPDEFESYMKLLGKFTDLNKQRIELTKHNETINHFTNQLENKGTIHVNNIFTNLGETLNLKDLGREVEVLSVDEEVEHYGKQ